MATRRDSNLAIFARFWLPVIAYVTLISVVSHQPNLHPPIEYIFWIQADKVAHVIEYSILGWLLARAFRVTLERPRPLTLALVAIGCGIGVAALDEYHQSFIPGRDSSVYDLMADGVGLSVAQFVYRVVARG